MTEIDFPSKEQEIAPFVLADGRDDSWSHQVSINIDGYGRRIITYAADWAWLMEQRIAEGQTVTEVADETSHLADYDGITGFMYGAAVAELAEHWVHGEELKRWHNGEYGQPDADGVVNPAIVVIEKS